jgi:hypothetical protein
MSKTRQLIKLLKVGIKFFVQFKLHLRHFALVQQHLSEYFLVSLYASLRKQHSPLRHSPPLRLMNSFEACQQRVVLESIGPSTGILIVLFEEVVVVGVLPLVDGLGDKEGVFEVP